MGIVFQIKIWNLMSSSIEETRAAVPSDAVYVVRHGVKATKWIDWNAWYLTKVAAVQVTLQPPWAAILDRRVSSKSRVALNSHAETSCIFFLSLVETHSSDPLGFSFFLYIKYTYNIYLSNAIIRVGEKRKDRRQAEWGKKKKKRKVISDLMISLDLHGSTATITSHVGDKDFVLNYYTHTHKISFFLLYIIWWLDNWCWGVVKIIISIINFFYLVFNLPRAANVAADQKTSPQSAGMNSMPPIRSPKASWKGSSIVT